MSCAAVGKMCDKLIITQSVTYNSGVLTINLPSGTYSDGEKYCLLISQDIPDTAIIGAVVVITIGNSPITYRLVNSNCTDVEVCQLRTRTRYATRVHTNISNGVFKLLGSACCDCCKCKKRNKSLPIT